LEIALLILLDFCSGITMVERQRQFVEKIRDLKETKRKKARKK
jgi:hypothetical protein